MEVVEVAADGAAADGHRSCLISEHTSELGQRKQVTHSKDKRTILAVGELAIIPAFYAQETSAD